MNEGELRGEMTIMRQSVIVNESYPELHHVFTDEFNYIFSRHCGILILEAERLGPSSWTICTSAACSANFAL